MLRNTDQRYGLVSVVIHWVMALAILGLFGLGIYMTDLTYYDAWYRLGPYIHEGIGVIVGGLLVFRVLWRLKNPVPDYEAHMQPWERLAASAAHLGLYLLMFVVVISGYFITTAKGDGVNVFDWFEVPALISHIDNLEDYAGKVHWYMALLMILVVVAHTLAALKHHFVNKDKTLVRMLRVSARGD